MNTPKLTLEHQYFVDSHRDRRQFVHVTAGEHTLQHPLDIVIAVGCFLVGARGCDPIGIRNRAIPDEGSFFASAWASRRALYARSVPYGASLRMNNGFMADLPLV
jgi:hypothetical protein